MAEKKPNISTEKVRIPAELMAELRRRKAEAELKGDKPPDFGELLLDAWHARKDSNLRPFPDLTAGLTDDDVWLVHQLAAILRDRPQGDIFQVLETTLLKAARAYVAMSPAHAPASKTARSRQMLKSSDPVRLDIPESDIPWVEKLLTVRHSRKPGLPTAVENNLDEFVWADLAWDELRKHQSPLVSAAPPATGRRGGPPAQLPPPPRAGGDPRGSPGTADSPKRRLDALEASDRDRQKRKTGTHDKTR